MENNNQKRFREMLAGVVSDKAIDLLVPMIPDGPAGETAVVTLAGAVKAMPKGMDPQTMRDTIVKQLSTKKKEHDAQEGDKPASSKALVRKYYDSMMIELRLMDPVEPTMEKEIFGETFPTPIMTAALSHLSPYKLGEIGLLERYAMAAKEIGCLHFVGMCENDQFASIMNIGAKTVRIVKPYADEAKIFDHIRFAEEAGAFAIGMDIDHAITSTGDVDIAMSERMARKSLAQMKSYVEATKLPFIFKGVLSVRDAMLCKEIGAKGILVSHHGGRISFSAPPALLLPEIRKAVGDDMVILVDCGITSGMDAYKAMALGADGVCVGTHLIPYLRQGGEAAVVKRMNEMTLELKGAMSFTAVKNCEDFDPTVIHFRSF